MTSTEQDAPALELRGHPFGPRTRRREGPAPSVLLSVIDRPPGGATAIAELMWEAMRREIPAYAAIRDTALAADVRSVSTSIVGAWLEALRTGRLEHDDIVSVRDGARRRARQGIGLQPLLKAYRVAIRVMWHELVRTPEWSASPPAATALVAEWALDFADLLATEVAASYTDEQEMLARASERRRSGFLELVLAGRVQPSDLAAMPELERRHAVIAVEAAGDLPLEMLDRVGAILERRTRCSLWTLRHRWIVAVLPRPQSESRLDAAAALREMVAAEPLIGRVGLGGDATGADSTAASYGEATSAVTIGAALEPGSTVHDFGPLGIYAAALRDSAAAARWADLVLEPLSRPWARRWAAPTLESYLAAGGNLKAAAQHLGVHVNTVKYRLVRLRAALGPQLTGDDGLQLLVALRTRRLLEAAAGNPAA